MFYHKKTIIIATSNFGSAVTDFYSKLADHFVENGFKVVFVFDGLVQDLPKSSQQLVFKSWIGLRPTTFNDFVFFIRLILKERPVLCISNFGSHNIVTLAGYLMRVKNRINYIHTTSKQLSMDNNRVGLVSIFIDWRKRIVHKLNTHFFTNSNGNKLDFIKTYDVSDDNVTVLPILIEGSKIPLKTFGERDFCLCVVARLFPSKGHVNLLKCMRMAIEKFPSLKLKIVGGGYLLKQLQQLVIDLNIADNVVFMGNINRDAISRLFSTSLISVSASIDEAFGLVHLESLREGTPVLSVRNAGSLDIIKPGFNGLFFDGEDGSTFVSAIDLILNDFDGFSTNALCSFKENYDIENINESFRIVNRFT